MDTDKVIKSISTWVVFVLGVGMGGGTVMFVLLMEFMPSVAAQLPDPIYDFFYSITVNTEPSLPTESSPPEPNDVSP